MSRIITFELDETREFKNHINGYKETFKKHSIAV